MNELLQLGTSFLGGGAFGALISYFANKRKNEADAESSVAKSAQLLVETMRIDMMQLKKEVEMIRGENLILQKRVYELESELKVYKALSPNAPTNLNNS